MTTMSPSTKITSAATAAPVATLQTTTTSFVRYNNFSNNNKIIATLDLHYYTKSRAIQELTLFLENAVKNHCKTKKLKRNKDDDHHHKKPVWVNVITGKGSHSHQGPTLRLAVEELLKKREMEFSLDVPGKASFTVNANSGYVLYKPNEGQQSCSKVLLLDTSDHDDDTMKATRSMLRGNSKKNAGKSTTNYASSSYHQIKQQQKRQQQDTHDKYYYDHDDYLLTIVTEPLPRQVKEDDDTLDKIKELSLKDVQAINPDEEELKVALALSMQEQQNDSSNDESLALQEAINVSKQQYQREKEEEEKLLEEALLLSAKQQKQNEKRKQYYDNDEDAQLHEVMKMSKLDKDEVVLSQFELEQAFQEALKRSLNEL